MTKQLKIEAQIENWDQVRTFIENMMEEHSATVQDIFQMDIAVEELFVNVANYAYAPEHGMVEIEVSISENPKKMQVTLIDQGIPYNPLEREDPDITLGLDEREIGGLGIYMVKQSMDEVRYEYKDNSNVMTIVKNLE